MRTSILAKWTALFGVAGVVFGLGAGSASAQIEFDGVGTVLEVAEGGRVAIKYRLRTYVAASAAAVSPQFSFTWVNAPTGAGSTTDDVGGNNVPSEAEAIDVTGRTFIVNIPPGGDEAGAVTVRGEFVVFANQDADAEDELGQINVAAPAGIQLADNSGAIPTNSTRFVLLRINDSETPEFEWKKQSSADDLKEGDTDVTPYRVESKYPIEDEDWEVSYRFNKAGYWIDSTTVTTITNTNIAAGLDVTIDAPANDGDRVDDEVTLTATDPGGSRQIPGLTPVTMTFKDLHALPKPADITWKAYTDDDGEPSSTEATSIVEGGPPVHVTVTVDRGTDGYPTGEELEVTPMVDAARRGEIRLEGLSDGLLTIESGTGEQEATFMVYVNKDDDLVTEALEIGLRVTGAESDNGTEAVMAAKPFMLPVEDETVPLLTPKSDEEIMAAVEAARTASADDGERWRPGDMFTLDRSDLFEDSDSPFILAARSSNDAVAVSVRDDTLTLTAMSLGTATITVTATVVSSVVTQTRSNQAVVEFDLTVARLPLEIMLEGPEDMNITEGMSATVTARANDPVTADMSIELRLTEGSASLEDFSIEPMTIMIAAGETTGTATVTAREDRTEEAMETLTIEGRFGDGEKTNALTFTIWDAAVPALPVIAQLLLAALLAVGGWRRYLRR